jgi:hypothetical protein
MPKKAGSAEIAAAIKAVYAEAKKNKQFVPPAAARAIALARLAGKNAKFEPSRMKTLTIRPFK